MCVVHMIPHVSTYVLMIQTYIHSYIIHDTYTHIRTCYIFYNIIADLYYESILLDYEGTQTHTTHFNPSAYTVPGTSLFHFPLTPLWLFREAIDPPKKNRYGTFFFDCLNTRRLSTSRVLGRHPNRHSLDARVRCQPVLSQLPPNPTLLDPSEWCLCSQDVIAVHPDSARP